MKMKEFSIVVIAIILFFSHQSVQSAEKKIDNDVITYRQIQSPVLCIDSINGDEMIIEDRLFQRFGGTEYFDVDGNRVSFAHFKVGTCVKVKTDNGDRLLALYEAVDNEVPNPAAIFREKSDSKLLSEQLSAPKETTPAEPAVKKPEVIKKEGNVWKN